MPLTILVPSREFYVESTNTFVEIPKAKLVLEHSLVSISKWESKWHKSYFFRQGLPKEKQQHSKKEIQSYIQCMTIGDSVDPLVYLGLTKANYEEISEYINDPMSATYINSLNRNSTSREAVTSEMIYYWMTALNIPFQPCERWHLNRLLKLIEICAIKSQPSKKVSPKEIARRNHSLNAARRAKYNTRG